MCSYFPVINIYYCIILFDDLKQLEILENVTVPWSVSLFTAEKAGRCISACVVL